MLRVAFDANVAPGLHWRFEPETDVVQRAHGQDRDGLLPRART